MNVWLLAGILVLPAAVAAQPAGMISGLALDQTGAALPGVVVSVRSLDVRQTAVTDAAGRYGVPGLAAGEYEVTASLINFLTASARDVVVRGGETTNVDLRMTLSVTADVTVTGRGSFVNLADVEDPAASLVGVALAASQGAVTARQLETRPIMRAGEVLETVPGLIISQHSGEGKANQYYLRGFNLDHGTDFVTTVAGIPVNLPTHAHGHGYADANFLIPELVSGVQYSKGPYFADQGDFTAAGSANVNYTNALDGVLLRVAGGADAWARALVAASPLAGEGRLLYAVEFNHNDGPWERPEDYRKINGVLRYSRGDSLNGFSITGMGYHADWDSTDQVPRRAVESGEIGRFGLIDPTDGGNTSRYSAAFDWQRSAPGTATRVTAYGFHYDLNLFSNFTFFLDDPVNGDQFEQADSRLVAGARATHRRIGSWAGRGVQHTFGAQLRNDAIDTVGLYHTAARARLSTVREDSVLQTSGALFYENQYQWASRVRTQLGLRADLYRFDVDSDLAVNSGTETDGVVSPKGGIVLGPWNGTELYGNAGYGFHSNDARGATITVDPATGEPASRVTPVVRARGAEVGLRTVAVPRTQLTFTLWTLGLDSELLFVGDAGTTEASRPSRRTGVEVTAYVSPRPWLTFDADVALSRARFTDTDLLGERIPGAVETVVTVGAAINDWKSLFGSVRLRYFGPRPLVEDNSVQSQATSLINLQAGYRLRNGVRIVLDVFNLFDSNASDIDYFYASRLGDEPDEGVDDIHFHPTLPRSARISLQFGF
jgi:TonB dependent receptor/Carboxypeptidase regulatory-like domain/TonB-dependent Receptor Plug Domain